VFRVAVAVVLLLAVPGAQAQVPGPPLRQQSADLAVAVENAALQRQFELLSAMPDVTVEYSAFGSVTSMSRVTGISLRMDPVRRLEVGADATTLLVPLAPLLLATGRETWIVRQVWPQDGRGEMQIRADEYIRGIPVVHGRLAVGFDAQTGAIRAFSSGFLPDRELPTKPRLSAAESYEHLVRALETSGDAVAGSVQQTSEARLSYLGPYGRSKDRPRLVWEWHVSFRCPTGRGDSEQVLVDSIDGMVVGRASTITYFHPPGPCQDQERMSQECEAEPDPYLSAAPHSSSCDAGKPAKPRLIATRVDCNTFDLKWPRIPGAAQYHLVGAPADLGWAFSRTLGSGYVHQCRTRISGPTLVKMRPCDGCGCGEWSDVLTLTPADSCQ
jgi:hypothetical protein